MTDVIATHGLTKRYRDVVAVDDLDLVVPEGSRFGFLGPNGSGKTTTVRMLLGLVYATSGRIEVLGRPVPRRAKEVLPHVGALVEGPAFTGHLSGPRNLALLDAAGPGGPRRTRRQRIGDVLAQVRLDDAGHRPVKAYSLGMKQRLGLAAALLRAPRLLVLDEPTNGLDPAGIREVRDLLVALNDAGTTVFLSSHLLAEVEQLCTTAAVVHQGRLVAQDDVRALLAPTGRARVTTTDPAKALTHLGRRVVATDGNVLTVLLDGEGPAVLNAALVAAGVLVEELAVERPTLEDVFLRLTGDTPEPAP
jgi:ABC-type multidrug transport system ATPase subunit